jgi:hypothetical protein
MFKIPVIKNFFNQTKKCAKESMNISIDIVHYSIPAKFDIVVNLIDMRGRLAYKNKLAVSSQF